MRRLIERHKDIIPYIFFGICTTAINIISYYILSHWLNVSLLMSTCVAWVVAVLFSYSTNRKWVFHSKNNGMVAVMMEFVRFVLARLGTGVIDLAGMYLFVEVLNYNDTFMKCVMNVIVIVLNYVASKLVIFNT